MKKFFTLIAATLVAGSAFAQGEGFENVIKNGTLDGTDVTNFKVNDYWEDGTRQSSLIKVNVASSYPQTTILHSHGMHSSL